jgi:hypothetical protein
MLYNLFFIFHVVVFQKFIWSIYLQALYSNTSTIVFQKKYKLYIFTIKNGI